MVYIYIYIYIIHYIPIGQSQTRICPHVIILYILYFICQKLYWTVSVQLSNIGYIWQFQNKATGTLRTRCRRTKAVSIYLMKILSIFLHLRKILICFRIGWFLLWIIFYNIGLLTVQYRLYWTPISSAAPRPIQLSSSNIIYIRRSTIRYYRIYIYIYEREIINITDPNIINIIDLNMYTVTVGTTQTRLEC